MVSESKSFVREERFIVVKRKAMHSEHEMELRVFLAERNIETVECVVVKSDWPEYETVWQMIEDRCTNKSHTPDPEALEAAFRLGLENVESWRRGEVQAIGAAISTRNWQALEVTYNQLRDKMDRILAIDPAHHLGRE